MTKDMWIDECERICTEFAFEKTDRETAVSRLRRIGLDKDEAEDMLNEAIS